MANARIECIYDVYDRTPSINTHKIFVEGSSLRVCLMKLLDIVKMYTTPDDILDEEEETGVKLTPADIISRIDEQNGDGCDFIMYLADDITGEVLISNEGMYFDGDEFYADDEEEELWS